MDKFNNGGFRAGSKRLYPQGLPWIPLRLLLPNAEVLICDGEVDEVMSWGLHVESVSLHVDRLGSPFSSLQHGGPVRKQ